MHLFAAALLLFLLCSVPSFNATAGENPLTPKASLIRYWRNQISNDVTMPEFLLSKASPLTAVQHAVLAKLAADPKSLSNHLSDFCSKANLVCPGDSSPSLNKKGSNANFRTYGNINFTSYGGGALRGANAFDKYSEGDNLPVTTFRSYSRGSLANPDGFSSYATNGNVAFQSFISYGSSATGGHGDFTGYNSEVNVPHEVFKSYSDAANGRPQSFSLYATEANSGDGKFSSYGKNSNGVSNAFSGYGKDSNVMGSAFSNYGEKANAANDNFTSYGTNTNVPENNFDTYGVQGNGGKDTFTSYRDQANVGDDNFKSYGKNSNSATINFQNYGNSSNEGTDKFAFYGQGSTAATAGFQSYGTNNTFAHYSNQITTKFSTYRNSTGAPNQGNKLASHNKWIVEPGKFFRETLLRKGTVMPMPDIRDKMPKRSFLPRTIICKLPFSTSKLEDIKKIFHAGDDNSKMITDALSECERAPSHGETKRCVASIEDMIDFATSVLGRNVVVWTTNNTQGHSRNILLGEVKGINGGKVTKSVSCHQTLFPYMILYCHSVPKVRVYVADILDPESKLKINHGVAICHLDTSVWSPSHAAFIALGTGPGKIEVCHWIFENDMTWATAD